MAKDEATDETKDPVNELCGALRSMAKYGCYNAEAAEVMRSAANWLEIQRMSMNALMASASAIKTLDLGEESTPATPADPVRSWQERQDEIAHLHKVVGWRAATSTIRSWVNDERAIKAPPLVDELRYWLRMFGGLD